MNPQIRLQILLLAALRIVLNTAYRMVYPFLPVFARGLGVDVATISLVLSGRSLVGAAGPLLALIADHRGRKAGLLLGMLLFIVGVAIVAISPSLLTFSIALVLIMLAKVIFDPSMHAFIGDRVPYKQRGTAVAAVEMSWSFSFILGIPLVGVLIARLGWAAPFPTFVVLGVITLVLLAVVIPADSRRTPMEGHATPLGSLRTVFTDGPALLGLAMSLLLATSNELVNIVFGVWIEDSYGLQVAALGAASAVIGLSELGGEGLVGMITDRLGKDRAIIAGLVVNSLAALLLPWLGVTLPGALAGLFLFYISFEFTLVSSIPLLTEVMPGARATLMSGTIAAFSVGRAIGALLAPGIYALGIMGGIGGNAGGALIFNLAAIVALLALVRLMKRRGGLP